MSRKQFGRLLRLIGLPDRGGVARRACCSGSLSPRFLFALGGSGHPVWFSHKETRVRALSTDHVVEAELSSPCIVLSLASLSDSSAVVRLPGLAPGVTCDRAAPTSDSRRQGPARGAFILDSS